MAFSIVPEKLPTSWKRTLTGRTISSANFQLVLLFNGGCLLALVKTIRTFIATRKFGPAMLVCVTLPIVILAFANVLVWQVYRKAQAEIQISDDSPLMQMSFIAFRLYICVLGVAFMLLEALNLAL